jgi:DNA-binding transcriptional MocR family regulator
MSFPFLVSGGSLFESYSERTSCLGMTNCPLAYGVKWVGIKMDSGGIIPEELEKVLVKWDEVQLGRRPRVLYIIP